MKNRLHTLCLFCSLFSFLLNIHGIEPSKYRFHTLPASPYYNGIKSIAKDSIGRIWYNGGNVLFMYDGDSFNQLDERITSQNPDFSWQFNEFFTDKKKNLFLTTNNGLFHLDYSSLKFNQVASGYIASIAQGEEGAVWISRNQKIESFSLNPDFKPEVYSIPENTNASQIYFSKNEIYFSTYNGKVYKLDRNKSQFYLFIDLGAQSDIRQILEYKGDFLLLTGHNGLFRVDCGGNLKQHYNLMLGMDEPVNSKRLYIDPLGILWVGTQLGILLIDIQTDEKVLLQANLNEIHSLPHNSIWAINPDPDGGVWIGTFGGKLAYMTFNDNNVKYRTPSKGGLNNPIVSCFEEDKNGNIWIGTEGGGVNFWDMKKDEFKYYTHNQKNTINYNLIKTLRFDEKREKLQIASFRGGINIYNTTTGAFTDMNMHLPGSISRLINVYDFAMEADSGVWASDPEASLFYKKLKSDKTFRINLKNSGDKTIDNPYIIALHRDNSDNLWLFTRQGLYIFDIKKQIITKHYLVENAHYQANILTCYRIVSSGDMWIGTRGGGVNLLAKDGTYKNFNEKNGFNAKTVFSILEDKKTQNVWLATDDGLYSYDISLNEFKKVDIIDTQIFGSFYPQSCFLTSSGDMLFGGTNGFMMFNPQQIRTNIQKPKVFLSGFFINNKEISASEKNTPLPKDISVLTEIDQKGESKFRLSYKQTNIGIRFSCNSYLEPHKNRFSCRLRGISDEWQILPEGQRYIQYSNLPSGDYIFEIKAANNDGVWGDQVSFLNFTVQPAPWLSTWAYLAYLLFFMGLIYMLWRYLSDKKEFQHKLQLEKIEKQKMNEMAQMKINFFTNISHDLKTPLTLVLDPLKRLGKTLTQDHPGTRYLQLVEQNVKRIQRMVNQLLEFRKIESKKIKLNFQQGDIIMYVEDIFKLFLPYTEHKHMITLVDTFVPHLKVLFDPDLIEKIFSNLFSNAVKYSPEGESVSIRIYPSSKAEISLLGQATKELTNTVFLTFEVINTGVEIKPEQEKSLFEAFSHLSSKKTIFQESSGLGLSITKELVQTLGGIIKPDLRTDEVAFLVTIPFPLTDSDVSNSILEKEMEPSSAYEYTLSELKMLDDEPKEELLRRNGHKGSNKLVIIEDDIALRNYLEKELSDEYLVFVAKDGVEGIGLAEKINPQIVITDLMMPEMDGFEVCKKLRGNLKTSHIPIIMLSALGTDENRIEGLKEGADVFIEKPFNTDFLIQQIKNLIKSRNKLKEIYSKKFAVEPSQIVVSSVDEVFFKKAMTFVENNIENPLYDVESFVSDMATSRTLLYRKINDATGMSIKEFILDMRLKRAAQLLKDSQLTISEIAMKTGFNESKYFSTCFKKHYGKTPSEFKIKGD